MADDHRTIRHENLDHTGEVRHFSRGTGRVVDLGQVVVGRGDLEPGWRWSTDVRPAVGGTSCQIHHLHILLSGRFAVEMDDGERAEFVPNDVMDIPPGHDAWVIGDEPVVLLDISGNSTDFALPTSQARAVVTMLMTDIVDSTAIAARIGDDAWRQRLADHDRVVRRQISRYRGREIDTTGDGFLAVFESAGAAILCALGARDAVADIGLEIRSGVHTGEVELLNVGIRGIAVHATARIMAAARASEVLVSAVTRELAVGIDVTFVDGGMHELKGLPVPLALASVEHR